MAQTAQSASGQGGDSPDRAGVARPEPGRRIRGWRLWLVRFAVLVAAPTLVLGLLELGLRIGGYGYPTAFFLKSPDGRAYVANIDFRRRFAPAGASPIMVPVQMAATKASGTVRIFVLGESAAMGIPDSAYSFSRILDVMLCERHPGTRFEVVNAALLGIGTHGVLAIAEECAILDPDLFIIYTGNNEIIGPYSPFTVAPGLPDDLWAIRATLWAKTLRVGQLMSGALGSLDGLQGHTYRDQDQAFFREHRIAPDDPRLAKVYASFRANLVGMCRAARRSGARVIVATVANNLRDCPPLGSLHRSGLPAPDQARWEELYAKGVDLEGRDRPAEAAAAYAEADRIDDLFADLHFRWARCLRTQRRYDEARAHYVRARDLDALPFRAVGPLNEVAREEAQARQADGVRLADVAAAWEQPDRTPPDGIPGSEWFYEHAHLTFDGNYALASLLVPAVEESLREAGRSLASPAETPSRERCAEALAFTAFDEARLAAMVLALVSRPPCPDQIGHAETLAALRLKGLRLEGLATRPERVEAAVRAYQAAMAAAPDDLYLAMNFTLLESARGRPRSAAAAMDKVLAVFPGWTQLRVEKARALLRAGSRDEAVAQLTELVRSDPQSLLPRQALAEALWATGDVDGAEAQFNEAIRLWPSPETFAALGAALAGRRRLDEAAEAYRKGLERFPADAGLRIGLARTLAKAGRPAEAVEQYRAALAADAQCGPALSGLAWLLATHRESGVRNGAEAVRLAEAACHQSARQTPADLDVLAAAYAEAGRFEEAAGAADEASRLASAGGDRRAAEAYAAHRELFKASRPLRVAAP